MKTLKDVKIYCEEQIESFNDGILEQIRLVGDLNLRILYDFKGRIVGYSDILNIIGNALKHHECEYLNDWCVMCGERKE